jgi:hypothetical protein
MKRHTVLKGTKEKHKLPGFDSRGDERENLMKTFIAQNTNTATGYELRIVHDNGEVECKPIETTYKGEPKTLVLPENPSNRKYFNSDKVDKAGGAIELTYKESKTLGQRVSERKPATKKIDAIEQYLTEDELKVWNELKEKAQKRALLEKAKAEADAAQAEYERLLAEAQA